MAEKKKPRKPKKEALGTGLLRRALERIEKKLDKRNKILREAEPPNKRPRKKPNPKRR